MENTSLIYIIGLILSLLNIWLFKNSRRADSIESVDMVTGKVTNTPVLKMYRLIILLILAVRPVVNIFSGIILFLVWLTAMVFGIYTFELGKTGIKIIKFLNKPFK